MFNATVYLIFIVALSAALAKIVRTMADVIEALIERVREERADRELLRELLHRADLNPGRYESATSMRDRYLRHLRSRVSIKPAPIPPHDAGGRDGAE